MKRMRMQIFDLDIEEVHMEKEKAPDDGSRSFYPFCLFHSLYVFLVFFE